MKLRRLLVVPLFLFLTACASTQPTVDPSELKTAVGRANDVRVVAQLDSDHVSPGIVVTLLYEIENLRSFPIAFAEMMPEVSYDRAARTISVVLGTEVPGNETLPRLTSIGPGQKKSFSTGLRMPMIRVGAGDPNSPRLMQINAHVLGETAPFAALIDIPERALQSAKLADDLFAPWLEHNQTILLNALPIQWNVNAVPTRGPTVTPRRRPRP